MGPKKFKRIDKWREDMDKVMESSEFKVIRRPLDLTLDLIQIFAGKCISQVEYIQLSDMITSSNKEFLDVVEAIIDEKKKEYAEKRKQGGNQKV